VKKAVGENVGLASNALKIIISCVTSLLTVSALADVEETSSNLARLQIGPSWNKFAVNPAALASFSPSLRKVALSTASFNEGTAFYIGKFNGKHVMATNTHVLLEKDRACRQATANFSLLRARFRCQKILSFLTDIELALFSIETTAADDPFFQRLGAELEIRNPVAANSPLFTVGHGGFQNPRNSLTFSSNGYCRTFSSTATPVYLPDLDSSDKLPYKVWSFAVGCNASWGDSGSPVVDPRTGKVLGLLWTSKFPKDQKMRDANYLNTILTSGDAVIWKQLTYASSLMKFREVSLRRLAKINANSDEAKLLRDLLK
jgi:hypothetical protein